MGIEHGMGFGLSAQIALDPIADGLRVSKGAFGWRGAYGTHVSIEPEEKMVSIMMVSTSDRLVRWDFENAVRQAIEE